MRPASRLYGSHIRALCARYDAALARAACDAVLIGAGTPLTIHRDDQDFPFRADPLFVQWSPLTAHPGSALLYQPGRRPLLLVAESQDYWHQAAPIPDGPWLNSLEIRKVPRREALRRYLPRRKISLALLGDARQWRGTGIDGVINPRSLLTELDYERAWKTAWEVECIRAATVVALAGHRAVGQAFKAGLSEFEMGLMFNAASGQTDQELPYPAIVAMNRHGATLHYQHRDRSRPSPRDRHSLLLDAGCSALGYASDITRSHAARRGVFASLIRDMDRIQQKLCALVRPGISFPELQLAAHVEIAGVLASRELVRMSPEEMVESRVTDAFLPHGLGHLLGLQVHDVGGDLASRRGGSLPRPERFPRLRLTRPLEAGMVLTIEPGLYFIDSLLARLRRGRHGRRVNWPAIDELHACGGIRIEDNVLVTRDGHRNLTRELEAAG